MITDVLVHSGVLSPDILARYEAEEAAPVAVDTGVLREMGLRVRKADLLSKESRAGVRHDPALLARRWARLPSFASEVRRQLAAGAASGTRGVGRSSSPVWSTPPASGTRKALPYAPPVQPSPAP